MNTYYVYNNYDSGPGSFRQAIIDANNDNTGGALDFLISNDTILLFSSLPAITVDSLIIGGMSPGIGLVIDGGYWMPAPPLYFVAPNSCYNPAALEFINFNPTNYYVTNTNDDGDGSFRRAIEHSQQYNAMEYVYFNIPGMPPHTITLQTTLPTINIPVRIDGTTQPNNGYTGPAPKIDIDGSGLPQGFYINADNCRIEGLYIHNFTTGIGLYYGGNAIIGSDYKRNVISGNGGYGILIYTNNNTIRGNWIGTDTSGTSAFGNGMGISNFGSTNSIIKNVISGNYKGIDQSGNGNLVIKGNKIGTDKTGSYAISNIDIGIQIWDGNVTIGGSNPSDGNLISGNGTTTGAGIYILGSPSVVIQGNKIGTNLSGTDTIPNNNGIRIDVPNVVIGGNAPGQGNLISGNNIGITSMAGGHTQIIGNKIGTDISGTLPFGNINYGIELWGGADSCIIDNNLISGNGKGIYFHGGADTLIITNNKIGTDVSGTTAVPNTGIGIYAGSAAYDFFIENNLVSGNSGTGIYVTDARGIIQNNLIGTDINDVTGIPNWRGIMMFGSILNGVTILNNKISWNNNNGIQILMKKNNKIQFNRINNNNANGVFIQQENGNLISRNSIFDNGSKGIDLDYTGNTGNDGYPPPVITLSTSDSIIGTSVPNSIIELYYNGSQNANPQGKTYIDSVIADTAGNWKYIGVITFPCNVTALAINPANNNTSEFAIHPLLPTLSGVDVSCNGSNDGAIDLSVSGGSPSYSYNWSNGDTTEDITGLVAGAYFITVTDSLGCTTEDSITIAEPPALTIALSSADVSCNGHNDGAIDLSVTGGMPINNYNWSNGDTTEDISWLIAGTYFVTVTDSLGCTTEDSMTIAEPPALTIALSGVNLSCNGSNDGVIDLSVTGGTPGFAYNWSNGDTTEDITGLVAGAYLVTVTDSMGCTTEDSMTIAEPPALTTTLSGVDLSCNGSNDGAMDLSVSGGSPGYSYNWSNGDTTEDITGLVAGAYFITITDSLGCTTEDSITIAEPPALTIALSGADVSCNGHNDGAIDLSVTGGMPINSYNWSNGDTTEDISWLIAGTYFVTVTDSLGCATEDSMTIAEPPALTTTLSGINVSCNGSNDGAIDLSVSGGSPGYSYNWSNGDTTEDITGLAAGAYSVIVIDSSTCIVTNTITINEPTVITTFIAGTNVICNGNSNGTATVVLSGGTTPYASYQWDVNTGNQTTPTATGLSPGNYMVTITDANGCEATDSITITEYLLTTTVSSNNATQGNCDGDATVIPIGGNVPYTYLWDMAADNQTTASADSLCAGIYYVTVTDAYGCTVVDTVSINEIVGVNDLTIRNEDIRIYPNPNNGNMQLDYTLFENQKGTLQIFDISGKLVSNYLLKIGNNTLQISKNSIDNGVYFYRVIIDNKIITIDRLVVLR